MAKPAILAFFARFRDVPNKKIAPAFYITKSVNTIKKKAF